MWGDCNIGAKECYENGTLYSWKTWLELFYVNKQNILDFSMINIDLTQETQVLLTLTFYNKNFSFIKKEQ